MKPTLEWRTLIDSRLDIVNDPAFAPRLAFTNIQGFHHFIYNAKLLFKLHNYIIL